MVGFLASHAGKSATACVQHGKLKTAKIAQKAPKRRMPRVGFARISPYSSCLWSHGSTDWFIGSSARSSSSSSRFRGNISAGLVPRLWPAGRVSRSGRAGGSDDDNRTAKVISATMRAASPLGGGASELGRLSATGGVRTAPIGANSAATGAVATVGSGTSEAALADRASPRARDPSFLPAPPSACDTTALGAAGNDDLTSPTEIDHSAAAPSVARLPCGEHLVVCVQTHAIAAQRAAAMRFPGGIPRAPAPATGAAPRLAFDVWAPTHSDAIGRELQRCALTALVASRQTLHTMAPICSQQRENL